MAALDPKFDIVIVGAGPSGLLLSACLARWGYSIKHIDLRSERTQAGRADGIQPRSLDLLRNMGLMVEIMAHRPGKFNEVAFWDPCTIGFGISRTGTWASCPESIGARYPFTTTLHQGLVEEVLINDLKERGVSIQRPWCIEDFRVDMEDDSEVTHSHPVQVTLKSTTTSTLEHLRAKYLFSGEGARSLIRKKLDIQMSYKKSSLTNIWGVIDARVWTNFPDIKLKCNIHSKAGSMMVIPREAGLVRFYIQLTSRSGLAATLEKLKEIVQKVLAPYEIRWKYIDWYSSYRVGQGLAKRYSSKDQRVFLGGDACHTHSPKAGQGMNTAFSDALNLAWKIHAVESGFASRLTLSTYESERMHVAETLLNFDAIYTNLFSQQQQAQSSCQTEDSEFVKTFKSNSGFTSGYSVSYLPNVLNIDSSYGPSTVSSQYKAFTNETRLRGGHIFPSLNVTRVVDASVVHLEQAVPLNGAYRIYIFAGCPEKGTTRAALADLAVYSLLPNSYLSSFLRSDINETNCSNIHCPHSQFYTFCTIFTAQGKDLDIDLLSPELLSKYRQHIYVDIPEGNICEQDLPQSMAYKKIGVTAEKPTVIVVRPDGYVGCTIRLMEGPATVQALNTYFGRFVTKVLWT